MRTVRCTGIVVAAALIVSATASAFTNEWLAKPLFARVGEAARAMRMAPSIALRPSLHPFKPANVTVVEADLATGLPIVRVDGAKVDLADVYYESMVAPGVYLHVGTSLGFRPEGAPITLRLAKKPMQTGTAGCGSNAPRGTTQDSSTPERSSSAGAGTRR